MINQTLTPLTTPPSSNDVVNFDNRADEFLSELPIMVNQMNTVISQINTTESGINTNVSNAVNAAQAAGVSADEVAIWSIAAPFSVANVIDLSAIDTEKYRTAIVKDLDRGGIFIYDATKVSESNDGTNFSGWVRQYSGAVNVKWFGAKGDWNGTTGTDDSTAIQKAINYSGLQGGITLIPDGTYLLLSFILLPSNTYLQGEANTAIFLSPNMVLGNIIGGTNRAFYAEHSSNISIHDIMFYSLKTGLSKSITIAFSGVTKLTVKNCKFIDFGNATYYAQGAIVFGGSDINFSNCVFRNNSGDGLALSNSALNYSITDNLFDGNLDWGLALVAGCNNGVVQGNKILNSTSTATGVDRCENVQFIGNTIVNAEHGIRVAEFSVSVEKNSNIVIIGNNIKNVHTAGISIENMKDIFGQYTVMGNVIEGASNQGIRVYDSEIGTIVGNTIYSCLAEAILFNAQTINKSTGRATVSNNVIRACTYGIRQLTGAGTTSKITVSGNSIEGASLGGTQLLNSDFIGMSDNKYFDMSKTLNFPSAITSSSASTGGIPHPTNVQGFLPFYMGGVLRKIPFYNE